LEISHCVVVNSAGDGIHLEGASGSTVDANLVANNENVGIQIYRSLADFPVSDVTLSAPTKCTTTNSSASTWPAARRDQLPHGEK
jgi:parallel beta-helix repeat protein